MLRRLAVIVVALATTHDVRADAWLSPALDQGLTGGLHTVYAQTASSTIDLYTSASFARDEALFGNGTGAQSIGFRFGAVLPVLDFLEFGVDVAGASVAGINLADDTTSFGDIRLRARYARTIGRLGIGLLAGYDLLQGVENISRVADVATPRLGLLFSGTVGDRLRFHGNAVYVYDRTINMLKGTRAPTALERYAWQMRDYTWLLGRVGIEWLHSTVLPVIEYAIEQPLNDVPGGRTPIHTISGGLKYRPIPQLVIQGGLDVGAGGNDTAAPAVQMITGQVGVAWRFGGTFRGGTERPPVAPGDNAPMPDANDQPAAPAPATSPVAPPAQDTPAASAPETSPIAPSAQDAPKAPSPDSETSPSAEASQQDHPDANAADLNQFAD